MKPLVAPLLILLLSVGSATADDWGPWEVPNAAEHHAARDAGALQWAVKFFQQYISPIDGPRCAMYPTCSAYALQALRKHGPLLGSLQTVDRLYREGDQQHEHQQPVNKWGYVRFLDRLEANDFWLNPPTERTASD